MLQHPSCQLCICDQHCCLACTASALCTLLHSANITAPVNMTICKHPCIEHITAAASPDTALQPHHSRRATHHLVRQHEHSLHRELSAAEVEQVLQAGPQQVDDHHIVLALNAIPPQVGDAGCGSNRNGISVMNQTRSSPVTTEGELPHRPLPQVPGPCNLHVNAARCAVVLAAQHCTCPGPATHRRPAGSYTA